MADQWDKDATAAILFFWCVDETDGITEEISLTGTPQVSVNGGGWAQCERRGSGHRPLQGNRGRGGSFHERDHRGQLQPG